MSSIVPSFKVVSTDEAKKGLASGYTRHVISLDEPIQNHRFIYGENVEILHITNIADLSSHHNGENSRQDLDKAMRMAKSAWHHGLELWFHDKTGEEDAPALAFVLLAYELGVHNIGRAYEAICDTDNAPHKTMMSSRVLSRAITHLPDHTLVKEGLEPFKCGELSAKMTLGHKNPTFAAA